MIRKLLRSVREYKKHSILAPLLSMAESVSDIIVPTLMAYLIDMGIEKKDMNAILRYGIILVFVALISLLLGFLAGRSTAIATAGFAKNLSIDMYKNVQKFSFSNIDKFSTSGIITRLTTDISNVRMAYQMIIRLVARSPVMMIVALFFSFRISPRLSLVFLGIIPVLAVGLFLIVFHVHPIFVKVFHTYDTLNNIVQENLLGIRVVKSYNREDFEISKFKKISLSIFENFTGAAKRLAFHGPLMQFSTYTATILLTWFGAKAILASGNNPDLGLTTGQLTSLITYTIQILISLMVISNVFVMIIISRASVERIVEILDEKSDLASPANAVHDVKNGAISFKNVSFSYSTKAHKPVLNNINLHIDSGETVGIIGGTGSSKSSLVQLIPRLYDATSGEITVGDANVKDYDLYSLREQVAMVLQKNLLFSGTIKENLRWGKEDATDDEMIYACKLAQAHDFIQDFPEGYDTYIEQGGSNLSGGQRQRLTIARALIKKPKILILDDSTSAVDTKTDKLIRKAFLEEIPNTTKIIISQRVASVRDADKIIVMDDGHIESIGTHEELLRTSQIYKEVHDSQNRGGLLNA